MTIIPNIYKYPMFNNMIYEISYLYCVEWRKLNIKILITCFILNNKHLWILWDNEYYNITRFYSLHFVNFESCFRNKVKKCATIGSYLVDFICDIQILVCYYKLY